METQQYQYRPLHEHDAIRIIIVHPEALISSPLSCSLIHSTLSHYHNSLIDQYTALSYVWGDANNTRTILVDEKPLSITASLETALRHMRDTQKDMMIWADGICINQSDTEEKSKQVRLMGNIYEVATHTIIFLGKTTWEYEEIFELLGPFFPTQHLLKNSSTTGNQDKLCKDLSRLLSNMEWFKRVWVLQELVLSRDPWLQVGRQRFRWDDFMHFIDRGTSRQVLGDDLMDFIDRGTSRQVLEDENYPSHNYAMEMQEIRFKFKNTLKYEGECHEVNNLLRVLHLRRGHGVLDPRDMIYGHLALNMPQSNDPEIERLVEIDYHKPLSEVYSNLALYLLKREGNFGFLSHVEDVELAARRLCLPSWVPDWTSSNSSPDAEYHLGTHRCFDFTVPAHLALLKSSVLGCTGTRVTVIESIKDIPPINDVLALCQEIKDIHPEDSDNSDSGLNILTFDRHHCIRAVIILYKYLCSWLGLCEPLDFENGDISFGPESTVSDLLYGRLAIFYVRIVEISKETDFRCLPPLKPYTYWRWEYDHGKRIIHDPNHGVPRPLLGLLMALTDCSGNFFAGKRIAVLRNRELALVPTQARVGDIICDFKDSSASLYILRLLDKRTSSPDLDLKFIDFFTKEKEAARKHFVEYTHYGSLIWRGTGTRKLARYFRAVFDRHINKKAKQAARRLPKVCDDHGDYIINPILKAKLDLITSNTITAKVDHCVYKSQKTYQAHRKRETLVQTDTSKVEHFQYVGECIMEMEPLQASSSSTGPDQESDYSFSEWYEKDLLAEILSEFDESSSEESFSEESFSESDDPYINSPTRSDFTTSSNASETSTEHEMVLKAVIQPLRNIIIALH
ncbi:9d3d13e4-6aac-4073-bae1-552b574167e2 [Sclerotinia trifoliorum]|uniref:9d3d13e4-6aac-4073-bae1-552b574167e2 n=1 Tax=Sclerotinia trifoliorum TaxID=28548 RepID=A0A8H2VYT9_9HELO|nr:9d3d13e4-6aac-4073-bae1-552b574167e2 [Sclerotinia trifoliorum]